MGVEGAGLNPKQGGRSGFATFGKFNRQKTLWAQLGYTTMWMRYLFTSGFILALLVFAACSEDEPAKVDCAGSTLAIKVDSKKDVSSCSVNDGAINVSASGGGGTYQFKLNDQLFQSSGLYANLAAGSYIITVQDGDGCQRTVPATVLGYNSNLTLSATAVTPDTQCVNDNGSITVAAAGGQSPFQYQLGTGIFSNSSSFSALKSGNYVVSVRDAANCIQSVSVAVPRGNTGTSYAGEVKAIIDNNCISCHRAGGSGPGDFTTQAGVAARAAQVKARTGNNSMPPGGALTPVQINLIACWVDDGAPNN